jgi:hypothetical protein
LAFQASCSRSQQIVSSEWLRHMVIGILSNCPRGHVNWFEFFGFYLVVSSLVISTVPMLVGPRRRAIKHYSVASSLSIISALIPILSLVFIVFSITNEGWTKFLGFNLFLTISSCFPVYFDLRSKPSRQVSIFTLFGLVLAIVPWAMEWMKPYVFWTALGAAVALIVLLAWILNTLSQTGVLRNLEKALSTWQRALDEKIPRLAAWNKMRRAEYDKR